MDPLQVILRKLDEASRDRQQLRKEVTRELGSVRKAVVDELNAGMKKLSVRQGELEVQAEATAVKVDAQEIRIGKLGVQAQN